MEKIFIIDDDSDICLLLEKFLIKKGYDASHATSGNDALPILKKEKFDLVLCDYRLPDTNGLEMLQRVRILQSNAAVIIITGYSDVRIAVNTLKQGAYDYVTKPLYPDEILLTIKDAIASKNRKKQEALAAESKKPHKTSSKIIMGNSVQAGKVQKHINLIAPTDMTVIIEGETGTGKEVIANAIHNKSFRKDKPFVAIDCGALPKDLAGSELFGHVKGAFTGAVNDKTGSFELANGGTLFMDEIGNLSYENQVKLLRVLQERKIKKLGGTKDISIDVRIIAATNEDLKKAVKEGRFREDIYHRLNEFKIELAPLREKPDDIMIYANHFLSEANEDLERNVRGFSREVEEKLKQYYWHGNLRELRNVVKRSVLLTQSEYVPIECLPSEIINSEYLTEEEQTTSEKIDLTNLKSASEIAEKKVILSVLEKTGYNKSKAAELLKVDRKTLYNKLKAYNIDL